MVVQASLRRSPYRIVSSIQQQIGRHRRSADSCERRLQIDVDNVEVSAASTKSTSALDLGSAMTNAWWRTFAIIIMVFTIDRLQRLHV